MNVQINGGVIEVTGIHKLLPGCDICFFLQLGIIIVCVWWCGDFFSVWACDSFHMTDIIREDPLSSERLEI